MAAAGPTPAFIDWWYAPWRNGGPALPAPCLGGLARRDAYRDWCRQAGVVATLPEDADWQWQAAAAVDAASLLAAAELFGGLLAARRQRQDELAALASGQRRWCLAVALTQPLADWSSSSSSSNSSSGGGAPAPRRHGLVEFALRVERALPGMWSRLALLLPEHERPQVDPDAAGAHVLRERDRRCWFMCLGQARRAAAGPDAGYY